MRHLLQFRSSFEFGVRTDLVLAFRVDEWLCHKQVKFTRFKDITCQARSGNVMKCYMSIKHSVDTPSTSTKWDVIITEWALDSYLNLKQQQVFSDKEYWDTLRPDVELLVDGIPSPHAKFQSSTFWGPAKQGAAVLAGVFKMKWRNIGAGRVQLRLPVMVGTQRAFLCEAYVKANAAVDQRQLARFKTHMNLISQSRYTFRGQL